MHFRLLLGIILGLLSVGELYAQASPITRKHLKQIIREGRQDNEYGFYSILGCNEDSLFFTADTIHFYDNSRFFDQIGICCEFVEWEFTGNNILRQSEPQTCMEPSSVAVSTIRIYGYRLKKWGGNVYFQLMGKKKPITTYRLINIEYIELTDLTPCTAITLVRVKKSTPEETPDDTITQTPKEPKPKKEPNLKKKRKATREIPIMISMERLTPKLTHMQLIEKVATAKPILQKKAK